MNWRLMTAKSQIDPEDPEDLDALILVAPNLGPGEVLCFGCGGIAKAKKLKPRPMPVLTPVVLRTRSVPNGAPMAEIQAIVNAAAGREVHPVPPPTEVEQDRETGSSPVAAPITTLPPKYISKSKVPAVTPAKVQRAARHSIEMNEKMQSDCAVFIAKYERLLVAALNADDHGKIVQLEAKLTFWVRRRLVVNAAVEKLTGVYSP